MFYLFSSLYCFLLFSTNLSNYQITNAFNSGEEIYNSINKQNLNIQADTIWIQPNNNNLYSDDVIFQNAITKLGKFGGIIILKRGKYFWKKTPKLPSNLKGVLKISGQSSEIILSDSARVFDLDYNNKNDIFRNYYIEDLEIDATKLRGNSHVLIGSRSSGKFLGPFGAENWIIKNVNVNNIFNDPSGINCLVGIMITPFHYKFNEKSYIYNILIENVNLKGGNGGFQVNAFSEGMGITNCYINKISILDCSHKIFKDPQSYFQCSNVHIGGFGYGDSCLISSFEGSGSGDNGIEINSMNNAIIKKSKISSPFEYGIYIQNYQRLSNSNIQTINIDDCKIYLTNKTAGRAIGCGLNNSISNPIGSIYINGLNVEKNNLTNINGVLFQGAPNGNGTINIKSLIAKNLSFSAKVQEKLVMPTYYSLFNFRLKCEESIAISDLDINISGYVNENGFQFYPRIFEFYNSGVHFNIEDVKLKYNIIATQLWFAYLANGNEKNTYKFENIKIETGNYIEMFRVGEKSSIDNKNFIANKIDLRKSVNGYKYSNNPNLKLKVP